MFSPRQKERKRYYETKADMEQVFFEEFQDAIVKTHYKVILSRERIRIAAMRKRGRAPFNTRFLFGSFGRLNSAFRAAVRQLRIRSVTVADLRHIEG